MIKYIKFFSGVFYLFFVLSIIGPLVSIIIRQPRRAHEYWSKYAVKALGVYTKQYLGNLREVQMNKKTMILMNHRTQGDFFIHDQITSYSCNFLARFMVAVAFPVLYINSSLLTGSVWFFRRGGNSLQPFFRWLDNKAIRSSRPNILVYPEGHRMNKAARTGKLKKGMLQYAYERKMDIQIAIVVGIEDAFNEKEFHVSWGPTPLTVKIDQVFSPIAYSNFEDFFSFVEQRFEQQFTEVYQEHFKYR